VTPFALSLILAAAVCHAAWNLLYKQASGGPGFVWLHSSVSAVLYGPFALGLIFWQSERLGASALVAILGSALLHGAYFTLLRKGYRLGDLSLIYPLSRGTGPALVAAAAMLWLGERPTKVALLGILLVVASIFLFASPGASGHSSDATRVGLTIGVAIALYTLWDKYSVSRLGVPPLVMEWGITVGLSILLIPVAAINWNEVRGHWEKQRRRAILVGILCPLSYLLILTALVFTPVSYIAPAREISILIGVLMGARVLAEGHPKRRLTAAAMMVCGVAALAIG
jgi:drug/metabolite transporter (DMT)-like permease